MDAELVVTLPSRVRVAVSRECAHALRGLLKGSACLFHHHQYAFLSDLFFLNVKTRVSLYTVTSAARSLRFLFCVSMYTCLGGFE